MTMLNSMTRIFAALAFAGLAVAQERITVGIGCPQGICEGDHTVSVTVADTNVPPNEYTVTVPVPEFSDSESVTAELAAKLNSLVPPAILCAKVESKEIDRRAGNKPGTQPPTEDEKSKRHDLVLPACLKFVRCAHTRDDRPRTTGQVTIEPASQRKSSAAPGGRMQLDVAELLIGSTLDLGVFGALVPDERATHSFPLSTTGGHPLSATGDWLRATFGATVTYPSHTTLLATFPPAQDVWFGYAAVREIVTTDSPLTYREKLGFALTFGER